VSRKGKLRKAGSSIAKKALRWIPQGCRDIGRPKNTWKRTVERELGSMKLSWSEAESKAQDRAEWRSRRPVLGQELKGKEEEEECCESAII